MMVLDTNVVSELMKPPSIRSPAVVAWLRRQTADKVYTTAVTIAEIVAGVEVLPEGRRRNEVRAAAERLFAEAFPGRVLSFDEIAARAYGAIIAHQQRTGVSVGNFDVQVAAIAKTRGMTVATRDTDLAKCEVPIVNPWKAT